MLLLSALLIRAAAAVGGGGLCTTDEDCQLSGVCSAASRACVCDAAWTGPHCTLLDFAPASRRAGLNRSDASSWGGSIILDPADGKFHLHAADMAIGCGLNVWNTGSRVVHATAGAPGEAFVVEGFATPAEVHNPHAVRTPNGTWLLFHIGTGNWTGGRSGGLPQGFIQDCSASGNGTTPARVTLAPTPAAPAGFEAGYAVHTSQSPYGPWVPAFFPLLPPFRGFLNECNNPAPLILSNGSLALVCRFANTTGTIYSAPSWDAPLQRRDITVSYPNLTLANGSGIVWETEDPDIYEDERGNFHMLTHNIYPCRLKNESAWPTSNFGGGCGGHAFSRDLFTWTYSPQAAYSSVVRYEDGSISDTGRERPQVVQDAQRRLTHLVNGFGGGGHPGQDHTWTGVVPLVTSPLQPPPPRAAAPAAASDLDTIASRIAAAQLPPPSTLPAFDAEVARNLTFVLPTFNFSDIDYTYCVNANWPAMLHPERTRSFLAAYAAPGSRFYHDAGLLSTVHGLLGFWLQWGKTHHSTNWWSAFLPAGAPYHTARHP